MTDEQRYLVKVHIALTQLGEAHKRLTELFLDCPHEVEITDFIANHYPFDESFEELHPLVAEWVNESLRRIEKITLS